MHLELEPYLNMGMRLGEGSGAALAMPIVEAACAMYPRWACWRRAILCCRIGLKKGRSGA